MFIYGKNVINEVLKNERHIKEAILYKKFSDNAVIDKLNKKHVPIKYVEKHELDRLVEGNHQGIVFKVDDYKYVDIESLLVKENPLLVILDHLEDPHNFGAIIRTCEAAGVDGIIIRKDRSVGLTSTVAKLSTGAIEHVPVACVANLTVAINQLKEAGLWIAGTDASEAQDYRTLDASLPLGLVIGSEGKGMSRLVREACDFKVYLPMRGHVTSLNASVAAALLMYEIYNKRNPIK